MKTIIKDKRIKAMAKPSGWKKATKTKEKCPHCGLPLWFLTAPDGKGITACEDLLNTKE